MTEKSTFQELELRNKKLEEGYSKCKKTEQAFLESEERYKSLFKNNHSIMLLIDYKNADIVDANPAALSYYSWSHDEITRKKITAGTRNKNISEE